MATGLTSFCPGHGMLSQCTQSFLWSWTLPSSGLNWFFSTLPGAMIIIKMPRNLQPDSPVLSFMLRDFSAPKHHLYGCTLCAAFGWTLVPVESGVLTVFLTAAAGPAGIVHLAVEKVLVN